MLSDLISGQGGTPHFERRLSPPDEQVVVKRLSFLRTVADSVRQLETAKYPDTVDIDDVQSVVVSDEAVNVIDASDRFRRVNDPRSAEAAQKIADTQHAQGLVEDAFGKAS